MMNLNLLSEPFDNVHWRVGPTNKEKTKGIALAYIDARDVQERLDDVCGPENWQVRHHFGDGKTACEIGIRIITCTADDDEHSEACWDWIWKGDGAGDTDVEASKGAFSDSFKRAAVQWGIGRYLYDLENKWVPIIERGRSASGKPNYVIHPDAIHELQRSLSNEPPLWRQWSQGFERDMRMAGDAEALKATWLSGQANLMACPQTEVDRLTAVKDELKANFDKPAERMMAG